MIKNIQQYLLTHYPTLWNIRLFPMILVMAAFHLFFFLIGYLSANVDIKESYYYSSPSSDIGLWYAFSVLIGILLFIGWLVFYMRNNALKVFYPQKIKQLYGEWILILLILLSLALFPLTLTYGNVYRWRSLASYNKAEKTLDMLDKTKVIIPTDVDTYRYSKDNGNQPIKLAKNEALDINNLDMDLYAFEYNDNATIVLRGYIGPSILFYYDSDFSYLNPYYYSDEYDQSDSYNYIREGRERAKQKQDVVRWFENDQQDSIRALMTDFVKLLEHHHLDQDVSVDRWFSLVYQSPYFPISSSNLICDRISYYDSDYNYYNQCDNLSLPRTNLENYYENIKRSYDNSFYADELMLVTCVIAFILSIFVFSYRVTSGRSWLMAIVSSGVLIFLSLLLSIFFSSLVSYRSSDTFSLSFTLFWLCLFGGIVIYLLYKIFNSEDNIKGRISGLLLNMAIWLLPAIIPLTYVLYYSFLRITRDDYYSFDDYFVEILWINFPIIILLMYPVVILIRKWKSLSDE